MHTVWYSLRFIAIQFEKNLMLWRVLWPIGTTATFAVVRIKASGEGKPVVDHVKAEHP